MGNEIKKIIFIMLCVCLVISLSVNIFFGKKLCDNRDGIKQLERTIKQGEVRIASIEFGINNVVEQSILREKYIDELRKTNRELTEFKLKYGNEINRILDELRKTNTEFDGITKERQVAITELIDRSSRIQKAIENCEKRINEIEKK
jgi:DNA repair ATPase RecN